MTSERFSWFKFYPNDWRSDKLLAACSLPARGLLVEILCLAHDSTPRGHLLLNGRPPSELELARQIRATVEETHAALEELLAAGVLSRLEGVIVSRRMVRDTARAASASDHGSRGGWSKHRRRDEAQPKGGPDVTPSAKWPRWDWSSLHVTPKMHSVIAAVVGKVAEQIEWGKLYETAACDYLEHGQPANRLDDLQNRARQAAGQIRSDAAAAAVRARAAARAAEPDPLSPEERARLLEEFRRSRPLAVRTR